MGGAGRARVNGARTAQAGARLDGFARGPERSPPAPAPNRLYRTRSENESPVIIRTT